MPTPTSKFGYNKPLVNNATDADLWGDQLNDNWDDIDTNLSWETSSETADFNVGDDEFNFFYLIDSSAGNVTATLPSTIPFNGFVIRFKAEDVTNTITLDGNGNTIDGEATITMDNEDDVVEIVSNNTNWVISNAPQIFPDNITLETPQNSTSGTEIDFTSLPAGIKKISVMLDGVSTSGSSRTIVQLGDSGGFETSGYTGCTQTDGVTGTVWSEGCVLVQNPSSSGVYSGLLILTLLDSSTNTWAVNVNMSRTDSAVAYYGGGSMTISAELDSIRVTTQNGTDTFDAGKINIQYES